MRCPIACYLRRNWPPVAVVCGYATAIVFLAVRFSPPPAAPVGDSVFDRWAVTRDREKRPLAGELIAGGHLLGLSPAELARRLGPPGAMHYEGKYWSWFIGVIKNKAWDFGLYDDNVFLQVEFAGDAVVAARIHIDPH